jgi:hypothetical protein
MMKKMRVFELAKELSIDAKSSLRWRYTKKSG